jgi:hypothetical protein
LNGRISQNKSAPLWGHNDAAPTFDLSEEKTRQPNPEPLRRSFSRSITALPRISGVPAIRAVGFKGVLKPLNIFQLIAAQPDASGVYRLVHGRSLPALQKLGKRDALDAGGTPEFHDGEPALANIFVNPTSPTRLDFCDFRRGFGG